MMDLEEVSEQTIAEAENFDCKEEQITSEESKDALENFPDCAGDASAPDESDDDSSCLGHLKQYFSQWGNVSRCIIKVDRVTGNSRGFGFVTFENEESVAKVLAAGEHKLKGKRIDPKRAKPSREVMKKIFVGGIDPELTKESIQEYFSQFGPVESLDLPFDAQKGKRKHYVFVSFATEAAAKKAISKERQEINGRQCDVRVAVTKEQASKNKNAKGLNYYDANYTAYAAYPYGDYSSAYPGLDAFGYSPYYGCYDYFSSQGNSNSGASGYGFYPNYATNQALFRNNYGSGRSASNNNHHFTQNSNSGGPTYGVTAPNPLSGFAGVGSQGNADLTSNPFTCPPDFAAAAGQPQ